MSSNHYVVRIYPLILPPSALFPSLHPSRLFPSLCCRSAGRLTTLNVLQPLFFSFLLQNNASPLLTPLRDPFICQLILSFSFLFLPSPAPLCVLSVMLQLTSTGLSLKCSLGQIESVLPFSIPSLCFISSNMSCANTICMNVYVCACTVFICCTVYYRRRAYIRARPIG